MQNERRKKIGIMKYLKNKLWEEIFKSAQGCGHSGNTGSKCVYRYKCTYLQNRNRVTDVENKLIVTKGEGGGGIHWETGIDIYTLLYIK